MTLYSQKLGEGIPFIILHGLFGMSDNWLTIGKVLAKEGFEVHLLDHRNHGNSPHYPVHTYADMRRDLAEYLDENKLQQIHLMGHSMGGKVAMHFALLHPEKVTKLAIVDIAPSAYCHEEENFHKNIINHLQAIDLSLFSRRKEIIAAIEERLGDFSLSMFLGKSIGKSGEGFHWKFNLPVLGSAIEGLYGGLDELENQGPSPVNTLFIIGGNSEYYLPENEDDRLTYFPNSDIISIYDAGHWLHNEKPQAFLEKLLAFVKPD